MTGDGTWLQVDLGREAELWSVAVWREARATWGGYPAHVPGEPLLPFRLQVPLPPDRRLPFPDSWGLRDAPGDRDTCRELSGDLARTAPDVAHGGCAHRCAHA